MPFLTKRKTEIYTCTWKDHIKERYVDFLSDLNTEHAFHCNHLPYLTFDKGDIRKALFVFAEIGDRYVILVQCLEI